MAICGCADDLRGSLSSTQNFVSLGFSIENPATTRAVSLPHENRIDHVYLMFFDDAISEDDAILIGYVKAEVSFDDEATLKFPVPSFLQKDSNYRLLALANADDFAPDGFDNYLLFLENMLSSADGLTMRDVELRVELSRDASLVYDADNSDFLIPMTGGAPASADGDSFFRVETVAGNYQMNRQIVFRRSVARVDVVNNAENAFHLEEVAVCNYRTSTKPFKSTEDSELHGAMGAWGKTVGSLYAFPNLTSVNDMGDSSSTGVILSGYYVEDGLQDEKPCYYRVNIGSIGSPQTIWPNSLYRLVINSVKGRGCATPDEAYSSSECLIEVSSDYGWNEPGIGYDIDDDGNFLAVSQPKIYLSGSNIEPVRVMVFASEKVDWGVETDSDWVVVNKGNNYIDISPSAANPVAEARATMVRIIGKVQGSGSSLCVVVNVTQGAGGGMVEDWELPSVALLPVNGKYDAESASFVADHVKVTHNKNEDGSWSNRIDVDGFAPEIFNSFIDIPMQLYVDPELGDDVSVKITDNLSWPLEGCISTEKAEGLRYTWESFTNSNKPEKTKDVSGSWINNDSQINISVGAMAPDDPAIIRSITLTANQGDKSEYVISIKPRPVIIDDVILKMDDGSYTMVIDRNVQDYFEKSLYKFTAWRDDGYRESQAYHYGNYSEMKIPGKFLDSDASIQYENHHRAFGGNVFTSWASDNNLYNNYIKKEWYQYNQCENCLLSPFYSQDKIEGWGLPSLQILNEAFGKLHVSKMRMFFLSDVQVVGDIPVCNYLPFVSPDNTSYPVNRSVGHNYYMVSDDQPKSNGVKVYFDQNDNFCISDVYYAGSSLKIRWLARYVRELSPDDLDMYMNDYLGYGSKPSPLRPCTPDTYPWTQPY